MPAPKSPGEMMAAVISGLNEKTGRDLNEWVAIAKGSGIVARKELVAWLKSEHALGHVTAGIIAREALEPGSSSAYEMPEELVDALYSGENAALRPIHDELVKLAGKLGKDVKVVTCKTYVGLSRKRQFALVKPVGRNRVELGLVLEGTEPDGRLERAGSMGGRITHRMKITTRKEIDGEVKEWLKAAYEAGG